MSFVRSRVGLEPIIAAAYVDAPLDVAGVERTLGAELAKLATEHDALLASGAPTPSHP